jgi:poly-gamma-glutamate capsule biosynthesis protein CapA/YwtB (metallophosphatase superfamily)
MIRSCQTSAVVGLALGALFALPAQMALAGPPEDVRVAFHFEPFNREAPPRNRAVRPINRDVPPVAYLPETEVVIAAVGDVIPHLPLQRQALSRPAGYRDLWRAAEPVFASADLVYANLETPVAETLGPYGLRFDVAEGTWDPRVYTGYPVFNAPPRLLADLKVSGVDIVSTANNHTFDRGADGVERTLHAIGRAGLAQVGARHREETGDGAWVTPTKTRGMRIAWVACTYGTNGLPDPHRQTLNCYNDQQFIELLIHQQAKRPDIDAVIVTPHFGDEYAAEPNRAQITFARGAVDAGATAVLGSHPHVVQRSEWHRTQDGRAGFIIYSLGNFISNQDELDTRTSLILLLGLARAVSEDTVVSSVRFVPIYVDRERERSQLVLRLAGTDEENAPYVRHVSGRFDGGAGAAGFQIAGTTPVESDYEGTLASSAPPARPAQAVLDSLVVSWTDETDLTEGALPASQPDVQAEGSAGAVALAFSSRTEGPVAVPARAPNEGALTGVALIRPAKPGS